VSDYGTVFTQLKLRGFSWKLGIRNFAGRTPLVIAPQLSPPDFPREHAYTLEPGRPTPGSRNLLRPPIALHEGTGILTSFPSTTPFGLALGTDSPCADERCAGNLGLTARELFTPFIATHVSIRTSDTSREPFDSPSQAYGTLSYCAYDPKTIRTRSFGVQFEPRYIFRAGRLDQ
jgi:hypothetical protein